MGHFIFLLSSNFSVTGLYKHYDILVTDKQQELDIPSLVEENISDRSKKKEKPRHGGPATAMSQVSFQVPTINYYFMSVLNSH